MQYLAQLIIRVRRVSGKVRNILALAVHGARTAAMAAVISTLLSLGGPAEASIPATPAWTTCDGVSNFANCHYIIGDPTGFQVWGRGKDVASACKDFVQNRLNNWYPPNVWTSEVYASGVASVPSGPGQWYSGYRCNSISSRNQPTDWGMVYFYIAEQGFACPLNSTYKDGACNCKKGYEQRNANSTTCSKADENNQAKGPQCPARGDPIFPLTGVQTLSVHAGLHLKGIELVLTYDSSEGQRPASPGNISMLVEPNGFGSFWHSSFHRKLQVSPSLNSALIGVGSGQVRSFARSGSGSFVPTGHHRGRLVSIPGGYRHSDMDSGSIETFDLAGKLTSLVRTDGAALMFAYSGDNLVQVKADDGRFIRFTYTNDRITKVTGPDGSVITAAYDANGSLVSLTWPDGKVRTFAYENGGLPWALTGVIDENNERHATFAYDSEGRAVSTEQGNGVNRYSVSYTTPPKWIVEDSYDAATDTINRRHAWQAPTGTVVIGPTGQIEALEATSVLGMPGLTSASQPAGSGCLASVSASSYDEAGNRVSLDDFSGNRTCFAYDANRREILRVEGLPQSFDCSVATDSSASLPIGARKITRTWHPNWMLPTEVVEGLRKTTYVYHGRPDPFNGGATASCAQTLNLPDGTPTPLLCRKVEQALSSSGAVDANVPTRGEAFAYDAAGRVTSRVDANGKSTTYGYYATSTWPVDDSIEAVQLLLHGDGENNSTAAVDSSSYGRTLTANGSARVSSAQYMFGGGALAFPSSDAYFSLPTDQGLNLISGEGTLELFFMITADADQDPDGTRRAVLISANGAPGGASPTTWNLRIEGNASTTGTGMTFSMVDTNVQWRAAAIGYAFAKNTWYHLAVVLTSSGIDFYVNGAAQPKTSDSIGTQRVATLDTQFDTKIGRLAYSNYTLNFIGYIDELRITKGVARYQANFTPPSAPFANTDTPSVSQSGHTKGDIQTITNAAQQSTTYVAYDPAGRVRSFVDPKGVATEVSYSPRGKMSSVAVTPPGGATRTTTYARDAVGQVTGVVMPDGTNLTFFYDTAHRLTGVTDSRGNSVSYTLDGSGNRVGEDTKDSANVLRRSIARSFDALNRVQQVTGAAD